MLGLIGVCLLYLSYNIEEEITVTESCAENTKKKK